MFDHYVWGKCGTHSVPVRLASFINIVKQPDVCPATENTAQVQRVFGKESSDLAGFISLDRLFVKVKQ